MVGDIDHPLLEKDTFHLRISEDVAILESTSQHRQHGLVARARVMTVALWIHCFG